MRFDLIDILIQSKFKSKGFTVTWNGIEKHFNTKKMLSLTR